MGDDLAPFKLSQLILYFLRLGTFGFGGPIALAGYMQRDLVEDRRWISREDYMEGLALAQLAPGPLAAQLAMYLGWIRGGILGATLIAVAFILPSFLRETDENDAGKRPVALEFVSRQRDSHSLDRI